MKKTILLSLGASILLFACHKQTGYTPADPKLHSVKASAKITSTDPGNSTNPMDYIGALHNKELAILESLNYPDSSVPTKVHVMNENRISRSLTTLDSNTLVNFIYENHSVDNSGHIAMLNSNWSSAYRAYATRLLSVDFASFSTYASLKETLTAAEATIMNDQRLSAVERETLLGGFAVARYSAYYHMTEDNNGYLVFYDPISVTVAVVRDMRAWIHCKDVPGGGGCTGSPDLNECCAAFAWACSGF